MEPVSEEIGRILELLTQGPFRIEQATRGIESKRIVNHEQPHLEQIETLLR